MKKTDRAIKSIADRLPSSCRKSMDAPLAPHTTFRTGGPADLLIEPADEESAAEALRLITAEQLPLTIIGGGSNLLISDEGLRGAVLKLADTSFRASFSGERIYASAFMEKEDFIIQAAGAGYGNVEFMAGIPGTIGGGIFMNAGTYMGTFKDILRSIKIAMPSGEIKEIEMNEQISGYRSMSLPENSLILGGYFTLPEAGSSDEIKRSVELIILDRHEKHPMEYPSAGSVFKNPEGHSSWKLVNDSGLKGFSIGGAMVSEKHTNFIINRGDATSGDIYCLIHHVKEEVLKQFGIELATEIKMLGRF